MTLAVDVEALRSPITRQRRREVGGDLWQAGIERRIAKLDKRESAAVAKIDQQETVRQSRLETHAEKMRSRPKPKVRPFTPPQFTTRIKLDAIRIAVERKFGVSIREQSGHHTIVEARHICWYLARTLTTFSLPEIGRLLGGGFHHTTVLHGVRKIKLKIFRDADITRTIADVTMELTGRMYVPTAPEETKILPAYNSSLPDESGVWCI